MAIILDPLHPEFTTAQDSQSRRPLIEILSQSPVADIPFDGTFLTLETLNEKSPNAITHSSGRLCLAYIYNTTSIKYVYSDVGRTTFTTVTLTPPSGHVPYDVTLCELDGGDIGIIYYAIHGTNQQLHYRVIAVTGEELDPPVNAELCTFTSANPISAPFVIKVLDGGIFDSYLLVYTKVDGTDFKIMMRNCTDPDFDVWSVESEIDLVPGLETDHQKYYPSLVQITTGDIYLFFDYVETYGTANEELTNIYYAISDDGGANWDPAVAVTAYTEYRSVAKHPIAVQKIADQLYLIYNEVNGAIYIDETTAGWCGGASGEAIVDQHIDTVKRKLYAVNGYTGMGNKIVQSAMKIDMDTWVIDNCWNYLSVPAIHEIHNHYHHWWDQVHGDGQYLPLATLKTTSALTISVIDGEADTITMYNFMTNGTYGVTQNVTGYTPDAWDQIEAVQINATSKKMYVLFIAEGNYQVGYIDLTEVIGVGGFYTFIPVCSGTSPVVSLFNGRAFLVLEDVNLVVINCGTELADHTWHGATLVHLLSDGSLWKNYNTDDTVINTGGTYPYHGLMSCAFYNYKLYGGFKYEADFGREDYRGLCEINLNEDTITYHRPSYKTIDDYLLEVARSMSDGRVLVQDGVTPYGVAIYDIAGDFWTHFDYLNLSGITKDNAGYFVNLSYDPVAEMIYGGTPSAVYTGWDGLSGFSENGYLKQSHYMIGVSPYDIASWGAANALVQGFMDYDLVVALDPVDPLHPMYAFWVHQLATEYSIMWDKEDSEFDVGQYIIRGSEVVVSRTINGDPATIEFEVSHGHLFDPHNLNSMWTLYLKKFRKLNLRFGEKILGDDHWQQAGVFFVKAVGPVNYERPIYPSIKIVAEDNLGMWEFANMVATDFYSTTPKGILEDIIPEMTNLTLGDLDVPDFDNSVVLYHQWIEMPVKEVIHQICERFGYYPRIDINGDFTAKKISDENLTDHIYSDLTKIIRYSPDDSYSDYTNKIVVMGEGRDWLEVLYNEESVKTLTGTVGYEDNRIWLTVWYSDDHSKRCRYPILKVKAAIRHGPYFCRKSEEGIIFSIDPDEKFFTVLIQGPDLESELDKTLVSWTINMIVCYILNAIIMVGGLAAVACFIVGMWLQYTIQCILGSNATYNYETYAQPVGKVRQSFQANADDLILQTEMGMIVERKFEDPLCYTIDQCQLVADFEMMVTMLQRNRVTFEKMADLQDEEGDIIQILHPFSGQAMRILITDLKRRFKVPSSLGTSDGYFLDSIEGWRL